MTAIYIAGPMRGIAQLNFPAFHDAERALRGAGIEVIGNPARWDEANGFDPSNMTGNEDLSEHGFSLRDALRGDLDWIADNADAIALLPGWERSKGAAAEIALGKALGLTIGKIESFLSGTQAEATEFAEPKVSVAELHAKLVELAKPSAVEHAKVANGQTDGEIAERVVEHVHDVVADIKAGGEVRVTSATGGQKGRKDAELATVDPLALLELAKVSGFGARKYESFNYLKGYNWSLSANAAFRHFLAGLNGEDLDPESGLPHFAHFAWHGLALTSFYLRGIGTDDRVSAMLAAKDAA